MKKKVLAMLGLILVVALAAGCGGSNGGDAEPENSQAASVEQPEQTDEADISAEPENAEPDADVETEPETTPEDEEEEATEGDAFTHYTDKIYKAQLDQYYTALTEEWAAEEYFDNDMSPILTRYYEGNPLDNVGFTFMDIDGDGYYELFIGAIAGADQDPAVFEAWTLKDDEPVKLCTSYERSHWTLCYEDETPLYVLANEASDSAALSANHYYTVLNGKLKVVQGIVFDARADEENPWFMSIDDDWDTSNDEPATEKMATSILNAYERTEIAPEYIPFSLY